MPTLAALCDVFGCTATQLIVTDVEVVADRTVSNGSAISATVVDLATTGRPRRARVRRDEH